MVELETSSCELAVLIIAASIADSKIPATQGLKSNCDITMKIFSGS